MATAVPYPDNQEEKTELEIPTVPFASAPEIYGKNTFVLDKKSKIVLVAENLASEAKYLLNILKTTQPQNIQNQFQIELKKTNAQDEACSTYKMSLRIDSVPWFKQHALNGSDAQCLEKLYDISSRYVEKVKSETEHYPDNTNEHQIQRIPITNSPSNLWCRTERQGTKCTLEGCRFFHYTWCPDENYGLTGECKPIGVATDHKKRFLHMSDTVQDKDPVYYQCHHLIIKLNRQQVLCNFHIDSNFWIYKDRVNEPSCYPYFIVSARPDATSVITLNPVKHCLNENYVQTSDAWQAVLLTLIYMQDKLKLNKLPLNRIYVNFGKWMQQNADDPTRRYCHAHINIVLLRETIKKINLPYETKDKSISVKKLFPSLVGSVLPPKSHRLDDSWELIKYMNDHMTPLLMKQNRELMRSISTLKDELEMLKQENEHLRQLVFGPTRDPEQTDDSANIIDTSDTGTGINDNIAMPESDESANIIDTSDTGTGINDNIVMPESF